LDRPDLGVRNPRALEVSLPQETNSTWYQVFGTVLPLGRFIRVFPDKPGKSTSLSTFYSDFEKIPQPDRARIPTQGFVTSEHMSSFLLSTLEETASWKLSGE